MLDPRETDPHENEVMTFFTRQTGNRYKAPSTRQSVLGPLMTAGQVQAGTLFVEGNSPISIETVQYDFDLATSGFANLVYRNTGTRDQR